MGRPRNKQNKGLPEHLYVQNKGGTQYYRYQHPVTRAMIGLGTNRTEAIRAARLANARLLSAPSAERLAARILKPADPFDTYAEKYRDEVLPAARNRRGKPLATVTRSEYNRYINQAIAAWGDRAITGITRQDVAQHLEPMPANTRNHARSTLRGLFAHAIADGVVEANPVEGTLKARIIVQRSRLTLAQYRRIYRHADPWLRRAMSIALRTLQRREDLITLTAADVIDGGLHVRQKKTGVNLRIKLWPQLERLLPKSGPLVARDGKPVQKGYLSRAFAAARDQVEELRALPSAQRPTLHELRALGALLYEAAGRDPQPLLGHLEAKTTRLYLDRHKERWIEV